MNIQKIAKKICKGMTMKLIFYLKLMINTFMKKFHKKNLIRENTNERTLLTPIVFKNSPATTEDEDLFGFYIQADAIFKAIQNDSNIIGIIGDYGTGKSSLTEILKQKLNKKEYKNVITINLWDGLDSGQTAANNTEISLTTKSFLYQLAFANDKNNKGFAKYINQRLSRNYGKISISMDL